MQCVVAVLGGDVADQGVAVVVDELVAETGLGEHPHLVEGQQLLLERGNAQHHVAVGIPAVVPGRGHLVLGHPLGEPHREDRGRQGIRHHQVGKPGQDIGAVALALVAEMLEIQRRCALPCLARRPEGDDVHELVGDDVGQPVAGAAQVEVVIERGGPYLDRVVIEEGGPVGVVVVILEDDAHPAAGAVAVELGHRTVRRLGDLGGSLGSPAQPVVVEDLEVGGLQDLPLKLGVVLRLGSSLPEEQYEEGRRRRLHRATAMRTMTWPRLPSAPLASSRQR